jgi:hypothetical protein
MERISELGTALAVTSNWSTLRRNTNYMERISELGTTLPVTSNWSMLRRNTNYMERISELGTTLAVTSNWSTLRRNTNYMERISELGTTLAVTSNWCTLPSLCYVMVFISWYFSLNISFRGKRVSNKRCREFLNASFSVHFLYEFEIVRHQHERYVLSFLLSKKFPDWICK